MDLVNQTLNYANTAITQAKIAIDYTKAAVGDVYQKTGKVAIGTGRVAIGAGKVAIDCTSSVIRNVYRNACKGDVVKGAMIGALGGLAITTSLVALELFKAAIEKLDRENGGEPTFPLFAGDCEMPRFEHDRTCEYPPRFESWSTFGNFVLDSSLVFLVIGGSIGAGISAVRSTRIFSKENQPIKNQPINAKLINMKPINAKPINMNPINAKPPFFDPRFPPVIIR